jgi:hypothetical protein
MMANQEDYCETLEISRDRMTRYMERDCTEVPKYLKGELVILGAMNISTRCPCRKLNLELHVLFEIMEVSIRTSVPLNVLTKYKISKVFHISLMETVIWGSRDVNLEKVFDAVNLIVADLKYYGDDVIRSLETTGKVTYLVKCRGFPSKKD